MNLLRNDDDTSDMEAELRALLRRRSAQLHPDQPEWSDLVERPRGVVVSLYDGDGSRGSVASAWRQRPKPVFIAAAVVAVVLAGGVAAKSATGSDSANLAESPASFSAAAPTDADFDAHSAPAVYASDLADPVAASEAYLAQTGVAVTAPGTPVTPGQPPSLELLSNEGGVAVVEWTSVEGSVNRSGTIILRANPVEQAQSTGGATWSVVGSTADGIALADVAYDGEELSFTVTKTADVAGPLNVGVWTDGEQVAVDGEAVEAAAGQAGDMVGAGVGTDDGSVGAGAATDGDSANAGAGTEDAAATAGAASDSVDAAAGTDDVNAVAGASEGVADADATADPAGQLVEIGDEAGSSVPLTAVVDQASTAIIRVQQLVDGRPSSVTSMAVDLSGTGADAAADVAGSGPAGSDANVGADVSGDADAGAPTTAGPSLDSVGEGLEDTGEAVDDAVSGGTTVPPAGDDSETPPSLPSTLPSIPTTLPAPPSGSRMP